MEKKEKEDLLLRLKMHTMFIELFITFNSEELDKSELNCLNDIMYTLNDIQTLLERL